MIGYFVLRSLHAGRAAKAGRDNLTVRGRPPRALDSSGGG